MIGIQQNKKELMFIFSEIGESKFNIVTFRAQIKYLKRLNKGKNLNQLDLEKYEQILSQLSSENQPQWDDPATKYFKNNLSITINEPQIQSNKTLNRTVNNHFLYPLCNSPKRKEYYNQVLQNHKTELQKQIERNYRNRVQEKANSYLKGDTSIPISDTYNYDFDRMQKQFMKYLHKEQAMANLTMDRFAGDPLKTKDHDFKVLIYFYL